MSVFPNLGFIETLTASGVAKEEQDLINGIDNDVASARSTTKYSVPTLSSPNSGRPRLAIKCSSLAAALDRG